MQSDFDPVYYLMVHNDVADAGMDAYDHFARFGSKEGRTGVRPDQLVPAEREMKERFEFLARAFAAISVNGIEGDYLEFGVGTGKTIWAAWAASRQLGLSSHLWAFDSFSGLPPLIDRGDAAHPAWEEGRYSVSESRFRQNCARAGLGESDLTVIPGWFSESLSPESGNVLPDAAALAYVDCDLYASTTDVLRFLRSALSPGAILAFDDWFCWSKDGISGEVRAFEEFRAAAPELQFHPYQSFGWHGMSFYCHPRY